MSKMQDLDFWLEVRRQIVHAAGILNIYAVLIFGLQPTLLGLLAQVIMFAFLSFYVTKYRKGWVSFLVYQFERKKEYPLSGAMYWALGAFLALILFSQNPAFAAIAVLAVADASSTMIGKYKGKHKIPFNRKKSWEGSIVFFFTAALTLQFFVSADLAILIAAVTAAIETLPRINDNVTIPLAVGLLITVL